MLKAARSQITAKSGDQGYQDILNTVRQAVNIIRKAGLNPLVDEVDDERFFEIRIRLPKREKIK